MSLRVNQLSLTVEQYLETLESQGMASKQHSLIESAVVLEEPVPVSKLPGFNEGQVSVQDASAQLAGLFMAPELTRLCASNDTAPRVLDACAAPGGKTCHLLELNKSVTVTALDISESRLAKVAQNLERLQLQDRVRLQVGDAVEVESWWDGRPQELPILANTQQKMLNSLWPLLKTGGKLLYVTCSKLACGSVYRTSYRHMRAWVYSYLAAILPWTDFIFVCLRSLATE